MNVLAGFDYVLEISNAALRRLLLNVSIGGVNIQPPFDLAVPSSAGSAHLIVDDVQLEINGLNAITLEFGFSRSTILPKDAVPAIFPLSGRFTVNLQLRLTPVGPEQQQISADFPSALVTLELSAEGQETIAAAAAGLGLNAATLTELFEDALRAYFRGLPPMPFGERYRVAPIRNGDLAGPQFTRLVLWCIGSEDRARQSLALFGNLFVDNLGAGTVTLRVGSAIPPGQEVLIAFSPRAFQTFVFCPAVSRSLRVLVPQLPTTCGTAPGLEREGATINSILGMLGQGYIAAHVQVENSGPCYEASGVVICHIRFGADGDPLRPVVGIAEKNFDFVIDWYCVLPLIAVWGLFGTMVGALGAEIGEEIANAIADTVIGRALAGLSDLVPPSSPLLRPASIAVSPSELAIYGRLFTGPVTSSLPELRLVGEVEPVEATSRRGVWNTRVFCKREDKSYGYIEISQSLRARYGLRSRLLALPLTVVYFVRGSTGEWKELVPWAGLPSAPVVIDNVECRFPQPLATGGSVVVKTVTLRYRIDGTDVSLVSDVADGNFGIDLRAEVRDAYGQVPADVDPNPVVPIHFEGSLVKMGDEYRQDVEDCMKIVADLNDRYKQARQVPPWEQALDPVALFRGQLMALAAIDTEQGQDLLRDFVNNESAQAGRLAAVVQRPAIAKPPHRVEWTAIEAQLEAALADLNSTLAELRLWR